MANKASDVDNYNRIFIIGARDCTVEDVREVFSKYGRISDVYFPIDKATREKKGVVYVTFSKASEAALAIEKMNGKSVLNSRSLKVVLASSKREGSVRDPNEDAKMLRLFIVIPADFRERDIEDEFKKFGNVVSVHIVKDKKTFDGHGLAYVKFSRAYDAAVALENCDSQFKPVFADAPKKSRVESRSESRSDRSSTFDSGHVGIDSNRSDYRTLNDMSGAMSPVGSHGLAEAARATLDLLRNYSVGQGLTVLEASLPTFVGSEQVNRLFDLVPGLEYCNYDQSCGRAYVKYSTPQAAAYAREKMDSLEYPLGYRISVRYPKDVSSSMLFSSQPSENTLSNVQSLVDSIQKATALLQQAGIGVSGAMLNASGLGVAGGLGQNFPNLNHSSAERQMLKYCSVPLPDRRSFALSDSPIAERLFIVSHPDAFDTDVLEDVFCRFGNMIGAYFMPGKKFGYVKYASSESARKAMNTLHGETVCGNRLKVMLAEPMRRRTDDSSKRDHSTGDSSIADEDEMLAPRGKHSRYD